MRIGVLLCGLLFSSVAAASGPDDFARQWPVLGDCRPSSHRSAGPEKPVDCEGAFALALDESVYRQVLDADLGDLAAFNADGDALPFGPMPAAYGPPPSSWRDAAWFALPADTEALANDLHLHVSRSAAGDLSLDASLSHGLQENVQDILIDVRADRQEIDAIALELMLDAPDFSAQVSVDSSDDLQNWRQVVSAATVAQLRQGGQSLVRRHIEFPQQQASYLRLHVLTGMGIPLKSVRLLLSPTLASSENLKRSNIAADFIRREGRAYIYHLPARIPAERLNIVLGDDNAVANFSVSSREAGEKNWTYVGQLTSFRLRGAGVSLDNEAMDIAATRQQEWRIEANIDLSRTPVLSLAYRPESWLLLSHGNPPFVVTAGSPTERRSDFPLEALVGQVRAKYGRDWQPAPASLGAMQTAGGDAALSAYDPRKRKTLLLWAVLLLGAGVIIAMVLRLVKTPPDS
jgi:hypothetical protein